MSDENPYVISVKAVARVAAVCPNTVVRRLVSGKRLLGVRIRFIKEEGATSPYRIHRESLAALRMRLSA